MLEQSTALPWSLPKFALCHAMFTHRSYAIALHYARLFQPPRSSNSPTSSALVRSCCRVSYPKPPTYRIWNIQKKNPIIHSVVLALGESNNKRMTRIKRMFAVLQDHTENYGVQQFASIVRCHSDDRIIYQTNHSGRRICN